MDLTITQWLNAPAGSNAVLDLIMIGASSSANMKRPGRRRTTRAFRIWWAHKDSNLGPAD